MKEKFNLLAVKTANQTLKDAALLPDPKYLYGNLVIEGEFVFMFAATGLGKTLFCIQIAIHIAYTQTVLYVDLELSDKQFEKRYRNEEGMHFQFPEKFFRATFNQLSELRSDASYEQLFIESLKERIRELKPKVLVLDNLTKAVAVSTEDARGAIPILNSLDKIRREEEITLIVIEHSRKTPDYQAISLCHLQGSMMKSNFCDSCWCLGKSVTQKNIRYVKQLKVRDSELIYDSENVLLYEISRDAGFLGFKEIGFGREEDLIRHGNNHTGDEKMHLIQKLKSEGLSNVKVAEALGCSEAAIRKWLKKAEQ